LCLVVTLGVSGCVEPDRELDVDAIGQVVLDLEYEMNFEVDQNDCGAGLIHLGDRQPIFVMQSRITRSAADLRERCSNREYLFSSAEFEIAQRKVNVMSENVAYVVREGDYTMNYRDGRTITLFGVMTTIWNRVGDTWKMVHLHESWEENWPVPERITD